MDNSFFNPLILNPFNPAPVGNTDKYITSGHIGECCDFLCQTVIMEISGFKFCSGILSVADDLINIQIGLPLSY